MELKMFAYKRYAVVAKYTGTEKYVVIPVQYNGVPVTEICAGAFAENREVEAVFIPKTLQSVGANAFAGCSNLKFVGAGFEQEELSDLPALAENSCLDMSEVETDDLPTLSILSADLKTVESGAFTGTGLRGVRFMAEAVSVGDSVFEGCRDLKLAAFLQANRLTLGKRAFMDSSISRFYAPNVRLETVPEYAFANCKQLKSVLAYVNAVGTRAFYNCENLSILNTPKELHSIGREAFFGCKALTGVKLPKPRQTEKAEKKEVKPESVDVLPVEHPVDTFVDVSAESVSASVEPEPAGIPDMFPENRAEPDEKALFSMNIDYGGKLPKPMPSSLRGCWEFRGGAFRFCVQTPETLSNVRMRVLASRSAAEMMPLFQLLSKEGTLMVLSGRQDGNVYNVRELFPDARSKRIHMDFFQEMLRRLKIPVSGAADADDMLPLYAMHTEEEFEDFLEVFSHKLPRWVVRAYHKNKEAAQHYTGRSGEEERKHAKRAQEILMNVDWLPCVVDIPSAEEVRAILDKEFYGLDDVKERIVEVLCQVKRSGKLPKWGILLDGPAGTGKTSIAKAIARVFSIHLIRLDVASFSDNPDFIYGGHRIYANARPGKLLEMMYQNRSSTGVLLLNEVDKAGESNGGKSAADALLSILDKTGFHENFLEETIPTDNLFCVGTCNDVNKISKPIRDRFLIIKVPGYTPDEKQVIFDEFVFSTMIADNNLSSEQIAVEDAAVKLLVSEYALEPGARDLEQYAERLIGNYCRNADENKDLKYVYTQQDLRDLFGPGKRFVRQYIKHPGQVKAAFYHEGAAYFYLLEATVVPGTGDFKVLGPMTDIQKEYCEVAYWSVRNTIGNAVDFDKCNVIVFVPQLIPESTGAENWVGMACYAAICSRVMHVEIPIENTCFVGGCDMNGSLYFEGNDLTPLLRAMRTHEVSTLFAPAGTNRLVDAKRNPNCNATIIEAPDAGTLFQLAVMQNKRMC